MRNEDKVISDILCVVCVGVCVGVCMLARGQPQVLFSGPPSSLGPSLHVSLVKGHQTTSDLASTKTQAVGHTCQGLFLIKSFEMGRLTFDLDDFIFDVGKIQL